MSDEKALTELIEEVVDRGATSVEEIHRSIAEMPLSVLDRLGLMERTTADVRQIQDVSLGAIYDLIRDINHKVAGMASDLLEQRSTSEDTEPGSSPRST